MKLLILNAVILFWILDSRTLVLKIWMHTLIVPFMHAILHYSNFQFIFDFMYTQLRLTQLRLYNYTVHVGPKKDNQYINNLWGLLYCLKIASLIYIYMYGDCTRTTIHVLCLLYI